MLNKIEISNYALIDNLSLNFYNGYSVITGETGAGKSIILKAIGLLLGNRADHSVLKSNENKCILEASIDISGLNLENEFNEIDIDYDPISLFRREFTPNGKSRIFINDTPTSLNNLKFIGEKILKIHTQHETLDLFDKNFQLETIDTFSDNLENQINYTSEYKKHKDNLKELVSLESEEATLRKELDYSNFLLEEFKGIDIENIDFKNLFSQFEKIENWSNIQSELSGALNILQNDRETISQSLKRATDHLGSIETLSTTYSGLKERINSLKIELDDIEQDIESELSGTDINEENSQVIQDQINQINSLLYKHNLSEPIDLLDVKNKLEENIGNFNSIENRIETLKKTITKEEKNLFKKAQLLSKIRKSSLIEFEQNIHSILKELGMSDAELKVNLTQEDKISSNGIDKIDFLFKTNLGGQFLGISKTASGGELSRLMLSILFITSKKKKLPTLIFDEIDTGVSGEIAAKMANLFNKMGEHSQLISITHLPQIASKAKVHYHVKKETSDNSTHTKVIELNNNERIEELAKMISGEAITDAAINNAKLLLNHE